MLGIGGSEWLVIAAVVIILMLVPGVLVFGAGFFLGKRAGEKQAEAHQQLEQPESADADGATDAERNDDTDGDADV